MNQKKGQENTKADRQAIRNRSRPEVREEESPLAYGGDPVQLLNELPSHSANRTIRQMAVLRMQKRNGNSAVLRQLARYQRQNIGDDISPDGRPEPVGREPVKTIGDKPVTKPPVSEQPELQESAEPDGQRSHSRVASRPISVLSVEPQYIQLNPVVAKTVIKRALRWLSGRGATVSKHVAKHTRRIVGKAVHTVFKKPNQVKKMVKRTLDAAENVVVQQVGRKTRYIVEKQFNRAIGKGGETILKVVLDKTGRIVTAYPVHVFTKAGAAAVAMFVALDEAAAETQKRFDELNKKAQKSIESKEDSFWGELLKTIVTFGLYSGSLNEGEDETLWVQRQAKKIMEEAYQKVLKAVEEDEKRSLGPEERKKVRELVEAAVTVPLL